jgi:hypothetical protein
VNVSTILRTASAGLAISALVSSAAITSAAADAPVAATRITRTGSYNAYKGGWDPQALGGPLLVSGLKTVTVCVSNAGSALDITGMTMNIGDAKVRHPQILGNGVQVFTLAPAGGGAPIPGVTYGGESSLVYETSLSHIEGDRNHDFTIHLQTGSHSYGTCAAA